MKIRHFTLVLLLVASFPAASMDIEYRLSLRAGAILPDDKAELNVTGKEKGDWVGPTLGGEFAVAFQPDWHSLRDWNNARIGVALSYWDLGGYWEKEGRNLMGSAIAPYVFLDVPLVQHKHFVMGIRPGIGAAFVTKTYRNTCPEEEWYTSLAHANRSIGSVFNFHFPEALYFEFPIKNGWTMQIAGGWYHISNGSLVQPNSGYNIISGEVSAKWESASRIGKNKKNGKRSWSRIEKPYEIEFAWAGGARQVYYKDRSTFFACELQAAAYWRAHKIFRLGGGVDVFYDGAYIQRETAFQKTYLAAAEENGSDCWRLGVSVQPEFVAGKFTAGFHFGVYLLDPIKNLETYDEVEKNNGERLHKGIFYSYDMRKAGSAGYPDGWLYTQIVLRYRLPWHFFVQGTMKAHITKVEFVSLGIGAWI